MGRVYVCEHGDAYRCIVAVEDAEFLPKPDQLRKMLGVQTIQMERAVLRMNGQLAIVVSGDKQIGGEAGERKPCNELAEMLCDRHVGGRVVIQDAQRGGRVVADDG